MSTRQVRIRQRASGEILLSRVRFCDSFLCRLRGLTLRGALAPGEGLLLVGQSESRLNTAIHMLFVFFDIAAFWLSESREVVDTCLARAWRPIYLPRRPARYVLEAAPDLLDRLKPGDQLDFEELQENPLRPSASSPKAPPGTAERAEGGNLLLLRLTLAALLALSLFPSRTAVHAQEPAGAEYVVQAGDTLYEIALRFGTTPAALQQANNLADPGTIYVGQRLVIPGFEGVTGVLTTHTLEPGETLASLSLRFGVSRATLVKLNRALNPARTYVGQSVILPEGGDGSPAVPAGRVLAGRAGDTLLGLAAVLGKNPWQLRLVNGLAGYWLPGVPLVVPGGTRPVTALPEPVLGIRIQPLPPVQGRTVLIAVQLAAPAEISGSLGDWPLRFNQDGEWQIALQGLDALAEPDLYPLRLRIRPESGPLIVFEQAVPMRDGAYGFDPPLVVDPEVIDPAVVNPEFERVKAIVSAITPVRHWDGPFQPPSSGRVVSFFGWRRSYNGGPYDSYHSGADYAGGTGTPILAPAPGVVVFAGPLAVRGNATIIDHGWGVYSGYWHQSEIEVTEGQSVETGQQIGLVGDTGRVTGPHLHWEVWVGGVQVDPVAWTEISWIED